MKDPARRGIPVAHFARVYNQLNSAQAILDDHRGTFAITEHFSEQCCQRIAFLAGWPSLLISQQRQRERFQPRTTVISGD